MMNSSMTVHRVTSVEVTPKLFDTFSATEIRVTTEDGTFTLDLCAAGAPLVIITNQPTDFRKVAA